MSRSFRLISSWVRSSDSFDRNGRVELTSSSCVSVWPPAVRRTVYFPGSTCGPTDGKRNPPPSSSASAAAHVRALITQVPRHAVEAGILRNRAEVANHFARCIQNLDLRRSPRFQIISDRSAVAADSGRTKGLFPPCPTPPPPRPPPSKRNAGRMPNRCALSSSHLRVHLLERRNIVQNPEDAAVRARIRSLSRG